MGLPRYLKNKENEDFNAGIYGILKSKLYQSMSNILKDNGVNEYEKLMKEKYIEQEYKFLNKEYSWQNEYPKTLKRELRNLFKSEYKLGKYSHKSCWNIWQCQLVIKIYIENNEVYVDLSRHKFKFNASYSDYFLELGYTFKGNDNDDVWVYTPKMSKISNALNELIKKRLARKKQKEKEEKAKTKIYESRTYPVTLRQLIFERDNYSCQCCGITKDNSIKKGIHLEVDHIIEWEDGGQTTYENGQTLCSECNKAKHRVKKLKTA